jgi:hypothetical protein
VDSNWITRAADPEHIAITSSAREDLFDQLAYLGLDDSTLANHTSGLPISVTKLEAAWSHPDVVTITPIDDGIGADTLSNWLNTLVPVWIPILSDNDTVLEATDATERIGIVITEYLARMWGTNSDAEFFEVKDGLARQIQIIESNPIALCANALTPGSTIRTQNSTSDLGAPTF